MFKRYGISVWGLTYTLRGDILIFTVSKKDAADTYVLLSNAGVPMIYVPDEIEIY